METTRDLADAGTVAAVESDDHLPLHRKITYAFTDVSGNLLYCIISSFLLYFFTEVFGLSVGTAGTLLLVARFFDALDAPIWGIIIDHTNSKYGKSRPWFLWMALPFTLFVWLLFTTPNISGPAKVAYAGVMYILAGISYTGMSTPITSVLPNLTSDPQERTIANSFRMIGGNIGNFFAVTFILPFATMLGGADRQRGWSMAVAVYAVVALVLLLIAFWDMREKNIETCGTVTIRQSLRAAKGNWPWVLIVVANVIFWVGLMTRNSMLAYFFQYNMHDENLIALFNGVSIIQAIGMAGIPLVVKVWGKWAATTTGLTVAIIGHVIMGLSGDNLSILMLGWCLACIGSGSACTMFFAMVGDTVDFGEWKTGIRAAGFLTAIGSSFCIKMGSGIGSFLPAQILRAFGYVADSSQSATALAGIAFSFLWLPAIIFAINIIPMVVYRRFERQEPIVRAGLKRLHAQETAQLSENA
ncbi:sugar (Glycoside-Pentoside-Hexuronide) transporter [Coriobacterium glomerans PW2]|uniref:Sugar (Glycoside-Pentoside-Hexuronide) transporter n=1 Tax=Coriobacterium glomerans (strain ATCC 49209 / DSM 20642 / JCM 10262 / PW2) TaxID=700015 RepID=F2N7D9_CORGP|nr:MFS transporter [Coriobacterium glomerans]AEB06614.1 sugar (Glycoside-Pentoside-Hexuronide) transporter [Coriobacterium glomerans PW2]